jgi:uncharacterized membrane protein YqiK
MERSSGLGMGLLFILLALVFIVGPVAAGNFVPGAAQVMIMGFGVVVLFVGMVIVVITRLYKKTAADEAFVRTGMGGQKPVIDGGAIVIPVVHNVILVSLQTMKLTVTRTGAEALITGDKLRADIVAEFYIKVQKTLEDVLSAATSLGHKAMSPRDVEAMVGEKLVNALRTVAATKTLDELHTQRNEFVSAVQAIVEIDLKHNGLTLESTTISKLDQTPPHDLRPEDNVFDAQGAKRIAEITQQARIARNGIEREADQKVRAQDVAKNRFVYEQDVASAQAEAERNKNIQVAKVTGEQQAAVASAEQEKLARVAEVQRDAAIQVAEVERARQIEVANQQRQQATSLAEREREIVVTQKEKELADQAKDRFAAESLAEQERQNVLTVQVAAEADRERQKIVIAQEAEGERTRIQMVAESRGRSEAAENDAGARLTRAKAEQSALELESKGQQAVQMVPVEVDRQRVAVRREDLKNQAEFEQIARVLQTELARIAADREVRIAQANAMGVALSNTTMTVWGTPEDVRRMTGAFLDGQTSGYYAGGLLDKAPKPLVEAAAGLTGGVTAVLGGLAEWLGGTGMKLEDLTELLKKVDPKVLEALVKSVLNADSARADEVSAGV